MLEYSLRFKTKLNHPRDSNDYQTSNASPFNVRLKLRPETPDNLILSYSITLSHSTHKHAYYTCTDLQVFIHLLLFFIIYLFNYLFNYSFIYLLIYLFIYLFIYLNFTHFDHYLTIYYFFYYLFIYLFISLLIYLFTYLFIYLFKL